MHHHRFLPFPLILVIFFIYTAFKLRQVLPTKKFVSALLTLVVFIVMVGWQILYRNDVFASHTATMWCVAFIGLITTGFWVMFILFSVPFDVLTGFIFLGSKIFFATPMNPSRRTFLTRLVPTGILGLSGVASAIGFKEAVSGPQIKEVKISSPQIPPGLNGMTITQITDLHISPLIGRTYVENVVSKVLSTQPDLIVVTGDLADGTPENLADSIEPLRHLTAPLGVYYVTGNHEYYWDVDEWLSAAADLGFIPFINTSRVLKYKDTEFLLGGVTDTSAEEFIPAQKSDPFKAMGLHKNLPFKILLAHRPESCFEGEKAGWNLQLSGHTHAGQFFPFNLLMPLAHKYYRGLNQHKKLTLYISAGTGFWGPPQRFGVPSEVAVIKL